MAIKNIPKISFIIPTLNEEETLPLLLSELQNYPYSNEIIIVDGGSKDFTIKIAEIYGVKIKRTNVPNRGKQLSIGAKSAKGEWLFFLHSDIGFSKEWIKKIALNISTNSSIDNAYYFNFKIRSNQLRFRILEMCVSIRCLILNKPYGDQGLLINKRKYFLYKGFKEYQIMEDIDFIDRLRKGLHIISIKSPIYINPRKWNKKSIILVAYRNLLLRIRWRKGESNKRLFEDYINY
tara:strand:+ start:1924 stop:2628 length:705 start_codon:yes stop_codon:yes gene_type:complete